MTPTKRLIAGSLLLLATATTQAQGFVLPGEDQDKQAEAFARIYATFCIKHIHELEKLRNRMAFSPQIPADKAKGFLQGQPGEAWLVPEPSGQFVIAMPKEKNVCMVYGRRAGPQQVEKIFTAMANAAPSPLIVKKLKDETRKLGNGPVHTISYEWTMPGAGRKTNLTLSTSSSDDAPLQALATAEMVN